MAYAGDSSPHGWLESLSSFPVAHVDLAGTPTTNDDLATLVALRHVERLRLDHTQTGNGLEPLARLTDLRSLSLEGNRVSDEDLEQLRRLNRLTILRLGGTQVSDAGLASLEGMVDLKTLSLHATRVTDAGLQRLCSLSNVSHLSIDDRVVTPAGVAHLQAMPKLSTLYVRVTGGDGRRVRELLSPLTNVVALGFREKEGRFLWATTAPWEASTVAIVQSLAAETGLRSAEADRLLDAMEEVRPGGTWQSNRVAAAPPHFRRMPSPPENERIQNVEEFLHALHNPNVHTFNRTRLFAKSSAAQHAIPAILPLLDNPNREIRRLAAYFLIRLGLTDHEVAAAIASLLRNGDAGVRAIAVYAFDDSYDAWMFSEPGARIKAAEAKIAVSMLLQSSADADRSVRMAVAQVLGSVAHLHPREAGTIAPTVLSLLNDRDVWVRRAAAASLGRIVEADSNQSKAIVAAILGLHQTADSNTRAEIRQALGAAAPYSDDGARDAIPVVLAMLRDQNAIPLHVAPNALGQIVRQNPRHAGAILRALLAMLQEEDARLRSIASLALTAVVEGFCQAHRSDSSNGSG